MEFQHTPVLLNEVVDGLDIKKNGIYVDCTIGGAGHSFCIANCFGNGFLIGFDKDKEAIQASTKKLSQVCKVQQFDCFNNEHCGALLVNSDFKTAPSVLSKLGLENKIDGVLIDLGVSSHQIDTAQRGFSFKTDANLDMRMDQTKGITAKEIVNSYSEQQLKTLFKEFGEEEFASSIAKNIVKFRNEKEIQTTFELRDIIENSMPKKVVYSRGGASKKVFQALRIEVNGELEGLEETIEKLILMLKKGGRIAIISFHSLEDRIVKNVFKKMATGCTCPPSFPKCVCGNKPKVSILTKKPIVAGQEELEKNSRASCAKLRIAQKL